jgi:hypothetical protein
MTQLSRHLLETLWEDGDFVLSRCTLAEEPAPVLLLAPASERPAPQRPAIQLSGSIATSPGTQCRRMSESMIYPSRSRPSS